MNTPVIHRDITIVDLIENYPGTVTFLSERGIRCIRCGEPIWGSLAEAAREKGFSEEEIDTVTEELKKLAGQ